MKKELLMTYVLGFALGLCSFACEEDSEEDSDDIALYPDLMCQYDVDHEIPFLIGRGSASFIDVLDAEDDFEIVTEYSVKDADGAATNPYDIAVVSEEKAYVSRFDTPSLLVVPASLVGNWKQELARFAPQLRVIYVHRSECPADRLDR